jgi:chromosome partitioning protein
MKGGVGKTTSSINIATGLAMRGAPTLLVDLDPQSNTTSMYLDAMPTATIDTLMRDEAATEETIVPVDDNLWLIPSELKLAQTEIALRMQVSVPQHNQLKKALTQVSSKYAYCIVDCPPATNLLTVNAIIASQLIIVPIKPERYALQGFETTIEHIGQIRKNWELDLDFKVLFTIISRNNEERDIVSQVRNLVGDKTFDTEIRSQPKPITSASLKRKAVIKETAQNIGVAADLRSLVDEIMGGHENVS